MNGLPSQLASVRVLVLGDVMLDEYLIGSVTRISPEAPVPIVDVKERRYVPGGAGNVAANVISLGAQVNLIGICGDDSGAETLRRALVSAGVNASDLIPCHTHPTTSKTRIIAGQQQIVRFDCENRSELSQETRQQLRDRFAASIDSADVCVLSDYGKNVLSTELIAHVIALANQNNKPVIVDPKGFDYSRYRGCNLLTPNLKEAAKAAGLAIETERDLHQAGARLLQQLPGSSVLITRGPDGMTLFQPDRNPLTISTVAQRVFDVVGAGDTAVAALAIALGAGWPIDAGIRFANIAAGLAVGKPGTVAVPLSEVLEHAEADRPFIERLS